MKFRKKPVVVDAWQYFDNIGTDTAVIPVWAIEAVNVGIIRVDDNETLVWTLEGEMRVSNGDWLIKGVAGEIYSCKPDIFEATYEPVSE